jgi:glutathione synthase/RimK-type ligase-like ATP-grasp enzyme
VPIRRVAILTARHLPQLSPDDGGVVFDAFRRAGLEAFPAIWQDGVPDADAAIVRTTWDYLSDVDGFARTLTSIAERMPLLNPLDTLRWNHDKRYLAELAAAGADVPPTLVVPRHDGRTLDAALEALGTEEVVVKPVVGAGGRATWRGRREDEATWRAAIAERDLLVQPFLPEVLTEGEVSLLYFGGEYSHAVRKRPTGGEFRVQDDHGGVVEAYEPPTAIRAAAERTLATVTRPWSYARVDGIVLDDRFVLMEIELVEPELFLRFDPASPDRYAEACAEALHAL